MSAPAIMLCALCGAETIWGSLATPDELARTTCAGACPDAPKAVPGPVAAILAVVPGLTVEPWLDGAWIEAGDAVTLKAAWDALYATGRWCGARPIRGELRAWIYPRRTKR